MESERDNLTWILLLYTHYIFRAYNILYTLHTLHATKALIFIFIHWLRVAMDNLVFRKRNKPEDEQQQQQKRSMRPANCRIDWIGEDHVFLRTVHDVCFAIAAASIFKH